MFTSPVIREITDVLDTHMIRIVSGKNTCVCPWDPEPDQPFSEQFRAHQTAMLADWYLARASVSVPA